MKRALSLFVSLLLVMGLSPSIAHGSDIAVGTIPSPGYQDGTLAIDGASITLSQSDFTYDGNAKRPTVTGVYVGLVKVPASGYAVEYDRNVNVGTATVSVIGQDGYTGSATTAFSITEADATAFRVGKIPAQTYDGTKKQPLPTVMFDGMNLVQNVDYSLDYSSNIEAGTGQMVIKGLGNFAGSKVVSFSISKASIAKASVARIAGKTYTGATFKPKPIVKLSGKKLKLGRDYTLSYKSNRAAGKAKAIVKGRGNYSGSKTVRFTIAKASISGASVSSIGSQRQTGGAITPKVTVKFRGKKLKLGRDYRLSYANNVNPGTGTATIAGIGNFKGKKAARFTIATSAPVASATASASQAASRAATGAPTGLGTGVFITNTGEKYHRAGCRYLSYSSIPISLSEAIARGYEACKVCHP